MGTITSKHFLGCAKTPICDMCGVALCWDISNEEYIDNKNFWDNWECRDCNPNYKGALKRQKENQK